MSQRVDYNKVAPGAVRAVYAVQQYVQQSGLEFSLLELVKMRCSQINGCALCMEMHSTDAIAAGENPLRLFVLSAWRETPLFTDRERAALAWAEAVTLVAKDQVPDEVYEEARKQFSEKELVDLTMAVIVINSWNRLGIAFRSEVGQYKKS